MTRAERTARAHAMAAQYAAGASLREVGAAFGVTIEGARQAILRVGGEIRDNAAATKANWQDPAFREKHAAATKANWQDPAFRERNAAAVKANWQDPAFRERNAAAVKAANSVHWAPEMDAALIAMRAAGHSVVICAERIGVSHLVITARLKALGLPTCRVDRAKAAA